MPEVDGAAQPRQALGSGLAAFGAKQEHRAHDFLLPAGEAGADRQLLELVGIGGMEEEPAAAEPWPRHLAAEAGIRDHHVAPELTAGLENSVALPHSGELVRQHMQSV